MSKKVTVIAIFWGLLFVGSTPALAQIGNIDDVLRAGTEDAELITRSYLEPLPSGFGSGVNSGWINSAEPHQPLGFDLQVRGTAAFIPSSDESFDLNDLDLQHTFPANADQTVSPTVGGKDEWGPEVVIEDEGDELARFNLPKGSGYPIVPAAMVQAGIGLVGDTDLMIRYIPETTYEDVAFTMKGLGLKHGINQWIPGGKLLPVDISIMGGFTQIDLNSALNLQPEGIPNPNDPENATADFDNQQADMALNTFTVKAFVGKDLPFISVYGGVGYENSTMDVDITGNYPINASFQNGDNTINAYDVITDPFSYSEEGDNTVSLIGGASLKLAFFRLFGEFTLAKYPSANAGIGFSFR